MDGRCDQEDDNALSDARQMVAVLDDSTSTAVEAAADGDHVEQFEHEETIRERFRACEIDPSNEMDNKEAQEINDTNTENKTYHQLETVSEEFLIPSTSASRKAQKRVDSLVKERKDEHKRWRTAIDDFAQYSEWVSKVSEKVEDMPDFDGTESVTTTEATDDPEAEYFIAVDSMREIISQIEKARAAQSEETAESDAKLEEIVKYCEERSKRIGFSDQKQDYQMFVCFACGRVFDDEITMRSHVNELHLTDQKYIFKCSQCYRSFKLKHHLQRHERTHNLSLVHVCDLCRSSFRTFESLIAHKSKAHRINEDGQLIENFKYRCNKCKKNFGTFIELNRHKYICLSESRTRHEKKSSGISVGSSTNSIFSLVARPKVDKTCKICNTTFASRQSLIRHMKRIHPNEKIDEIKRYEVAPSPDLPFACIICSKRFATKTLMLVHRKRHEGRNFACEFCEKTYPLASELRKHIKRVHGASRQGTSMSSIPGSDDTMQEDIVNTQNSNTEETEQMQEESCRSNYEDLNDFNVL